MINDPLSCTTRSSPERVILLPAAEKSTRIFPQVRPFFLRVAREDVAYDELHHFSHIAYYIFTFFFGSNRADQ